MIAEKQKVYFVLFSRCLSAEALPIFSCHGVLTRKVVADTYLHLPQAK